MRRDVLIRNGLEGWLCRSGIWMALEGLSGDTVYNSNLGNSNLLWVFFEKFVTLFGS